MNWAWGTTTIWGTATVCARPCSGARDRNAGFSKANPHKLYLPVIIDPEYHCEMVNVETQERNPSSLLWWMRRVIAMRKRFQAFGRGGIRFVTCENPKVLAFVRFHEEETILVVVNLSRFSQVVEMDLSEYAGMVPVDVFSDTRFPVVRKEPYVLPMGFHDYFWFRLTPEDAAGVMEGSALQSSGTPELVITGKGKAMDLTLLHKGLEEKVLPHCGNRQWFGDSAAKVRSATVVDSIPLFPGEAFPRLLLLELQYSEGPQDMLMLPVSLAQGGMGGENPRRVPGVRIGASCLERRQGRAVRRIAGRALPPGVADGHCQETQHQGAAGRHFRQARQTVQGLRPGRCRGHGLIAFQGSDA